MVYNTKKECKGMQCLVFIHMKSYTTSCKATNLHQACPVACNIINSPQVCVSMPQTHVTTKKRIKPIKKPQMVDVGY